MIVYSILFILSPGSSGSCNGKVTMCSVSSEPIQNRIFSDAGGACDNNQEGWCGDNQRYRSMT